jgi:hypothetical protein
MEGYYAMAELNQAILWAQYYLAHFWLQPTFQAVVVGGVMFISTVLVMNTRLVLVGLGLLGMIMALGLGLLVSNTQVVPMTIAGFCLEQYWAYCSHSQSGQMSRFDRPITRQRRTPAPAWCVFHLPHDYFCTSLSSSACASESVVVGFIGSG